MGYTISNNKKSYTLNHTEYSLAKKYCKKYGTSYYIATLFFPKSIRMATWVIYAFVRIVDEIVDTEETDTSVAKERILHYQQEFESAYLLKNHSDPILHALVHILPLFEIEKKWIDAFFDAMLMDTTVSRYKNYAQLETYMYGSAGVIGLIMMQIIGTKSDVKEEAISLGYAMQLTNFLRDINEDYSLRNRIYIPTDDLQKYTITETAFKNKTCDTQFQELMKMYIKKTRSLFDKSDIGIQELHSRGRRAVYIARLLYSNILNEIENSQYNIFIKRHRVPMHKKVFLIMNGLIKTIYGK